MIRSFHCKQTEKLHAAERVRVFEGVAESARRRLRLLDTACSLEDLRNMRSNRLEALSGDRVGQYSIRVNDRWRICFRWELGHAFDVEIVDYH